MQISSISQLRHWEGNSFSLEIFFFLCAFRDWFSRMGREQLRTQLPFACANLWSLFSPSRPPPSPLEAEWIGNAAQSARIALFLVPRDCRVYPCLSEVYEKNRDFCVAGSPSVKRGRNERSNEWGKDVRRNYLLPWLRTIRIESA